MSTGKSRNAQGVVMTLTGGILWGLCGSCGQFLFQYKEATSNWLVPIRLMGAGILILLLLAVKNTLVYVAVTVPVSMVLGYFLALLCRKKRKSSFVYEAMFALPMAVSTSVVAMIFQLAYNPSMGIINKLTGLNVNWLSDQKLALISIMIVQIWANVGYNFIFILSGVRGLSEEVMESAAIDGVSGIQMQTKIILPMLSPTLLFLLVKDVAYAMTTASFTLIMTEGGPNGATETMISYIYKKAITGTNYNAAFAATTVCFVLSALMMALSMALEGKKVHYDQ